MGWSVPLAPVVPVVPVLPLPLPPGVVSFSVPALPPIVLLPPPGVLLLPVAPGFVSPNGPLPVVPPVPSAPPPSFVRLSSQLVVAPLPVQLTPGVVVMVPVLSWAKAAPGTHSTASVEASMLSLMGVLHCDPCSQQVRGVLVAVFGRLAWGQMPQARTEPVELRSACIQYGELPRLVAAAFSSATAVSTAARARTGAART